MNTKQDLVERLQIEAKACQRYSQKAIDLAKVGKVSTALNMLDIAKCALTCTNQVHEQLWDLTNGNLTAEEFEIFCQSETVSTLFNQAVKAVKSAR